MYITFDNLKNELPANTLINLLNDIKVLLTLEMLEAAAAESPNLDAYTPEQAAAATAAIARFIEMAGRVEGLVNGFCARLYLVPFAAVPPIIPPLCLKILIYDLFCRKSTDEVPKSRKDQNDASMNTLKLISEGKVSLGAAAIPAPSQQSPQPAMVPLNGTFSRDNMKGF